jgi:hypothetical protein
MLSEMSWVRWVAGLIWSCHNVTAVQEPFVQCLHVR